LVDDLGNLPQALETAAQMAGITKRPLVILQEEEEHPLVRLLQGFLNTRLFPSSLQETGFSLQYR